MRNDARAGCPVWWAAMAVRLADLNPADVDMRCLLIGGSSQTQWYSHDSGDRVFNPRHHPT
jgi:precorrin-2 C20-methyltransferase / precorrin-3B C17-methyltransferase